MVFKFMLKNNSVIKSLFKKKVYIRVELHFTNSKLILRQNS